ncbi:MAG: D-alanine--D-alanine ligase family protein [Candidatus Dormibacteria bacterium]|jgi:D-alanine-D-alanine ligase
MSLSGVTVAPVFGSRSVEHEISIITACQAMPVLAELGARLIPIYITKQGRWLTHPSFTDLATFRKRLPEEGGTVLLDLAKGQLLVGGGSLLGRPRELGDLVLFPLLHGTFGEDGNLAGLAAMARLPQVGSGTLAAALAMDKLRSKQVLRAAGLPAVPSLAAGDAEQARRVAAQLGFPVVVKPNRGGSSVGVGLAGDELELARAAELALEYDTGLVLEPAVPGAMDLNCAVKLREPRFSEVERPVKGTGPLSYADKYAGQGKRAGPLSAGGKRAGAKASSGDPRRELPAAIPEATRAEVQRLAVRAFDALGCAGSARVDFLLSETGELYVNEVNTLPGSLAFYLWEASGVPFPALLEELVQEALEAVEHRTLTLPQNLLAPDQVLGKG